MAISDAQRHDLHMGLDEVLGADRANILMEYLPPAGWADIATKRDLDVLEERLRGEMELIRTELRNEIAGLRTELHNEIGRLRTELHNEVGGLRKDFELIGAQQLAALARQQLHHTLAMIAILGTLMAVINAFG